MGNVNLLTRLKNGRLAPVSDVCGCTRTWGRHAQNPQRLLLRCNYACRMVKGFVAVVPCLEIRHTPVAPSLSKGRLCWQSLEDVPSLEALTPSRGCSTSEGSQASAWQARRALSTTIPSVPVVVQKAEKGRGRRMNILRLTESSAEGKDGCREYRLLYTLDN